MSSETEVYKVDKTGWPPGPWMDEPDKLLWRTRVGLPGLIVRHARYGFFCGYAAVPQGHPLYGVDWRSGRIHDDPDDDSPECRDQLDGLTTYQVNYSDRCRGAICHVPEPGQPADVWWFGFDCGHSFDAQPGRWALDDAVDEAIGTPPELRKKFRAMETYCDLEWVKGEVERLAKGLARLG
jgi:hypothetical protein